MTGEDSQEHAPDPDHPDTSEASGWRGRIAALLGEVKPLLDHLTYRVDAARWQAWGPFLAALKDLAWTLFTLAQHWRELAARDDWDTVSQNIDAMRHELIEQARAVAEVFPGALEIFFGVESIDEMVRSLRDEERGRELVLAALRRLEDGVDALILRVIDLILEPGTRADAARAQEALSRLDAFFEKVLEHVILPRVITPSPDWQHGAAEEE